MMQQESAAPSAIASSRVGEGSSNARPTCLLMKTNHTLVPAWYVNDMGVGGALSYARMMCQEGAACWFPSTLNASEISESEYLLDQVLLYTEPGASRSCV